MSGADLVAGKLDLREPCYLVFFPSTGNYDQEYSQVATLAQLSEQIANRSVAVPLGLDVKSKEVVHRGS